jgi:hypothetical protein
VPILRERGVMRDLLIEAQSGKPTARHMHAQFLDQLALAGDAVRIADEEDAQQKLGIDGWAARIAVTLFQLFPYEGKADVLIDEPQQVSPRNLIFQTEVVEQSFRTRMLSHYD